MLVTKDYIKYADKNDVLNYLFIKLNVFNEIVYKREGMYEDPKNVIEWIDYFLEAFDEIKSKCVLSNEILDKVRRIKSFRREVIKDL